MAEEDPIAALAASLAAEDVPVKLRCATCSLIAYNAWRLPCCEQNICETCYNELEDVCQVCHHEPLDKSLCTANKSLRTTTKVFLKRKLLERSKEQKINVVKAPAPVQAKTAAEEPEVKGTNAVALMSPVEPASATGSQGGFHASTEDRQDNDPATTEGNTENDSTLEGDHAESNEAYSASQMAPAGNQNQDPGIQMNAMNNGGAFPMDMASMMAMQAMPNMMGMGMDPMMMNAMASSMLGGFGGPNMGMAGMNMGMGQNQFGGPWMAGQDSYGASARGNGNYGNQVGYQMPSHHGNFNQMNQEQYTHNDFHSGYGRQGSYFRGGRGRRGGFRGGYGHQQGYMNQAGHAYANNRIANGQHPLQPGSNAANLQHQTSINDPDDAVLSDANAADTSASANEQQAEDGLVRSLARPTTSPSTQIEPPALSEADDSRMEVNADADGHVSDRPLPIQTFISDEPRSRTATARNEVPIGPSSQYTSDRSFAASNGISDSGAPHVPRVLGVPGAPTGPKALREGYRNTNNRGNFRGSNHRGVPLPTSEPERAQKSPSHVQKVSETERRSRSRSNTPSRNSHHHKDDHADNRENPRDASRDAEFGAYQQGNGNDNDDPLQRDDQVSQRHADRRESRQQYGDGDAGNDDADHWDNRSQGQTEHRMGDHGNERGFPTNNDMNNRYDGSRNEDDCEEKSRRHHRTPRGSTSPSIDEKSRDRESRRRRKREDDDDDDDPHSHTRIRDRDYDKHDHHHRKRSRRDRDHDRSRERNRDRDRDRDRNRSSRHTGSSREASKTNTPVNDPSSSHSRRESFAKVSASQAYRPSGRLIPSGPKADLKRNLGGPTHQKSRHARRGSVDYVRQNHEKNTSTAEKDPHTLEREARDRERLQKEMQRRATQEGGRSRGGDHSRRSSEKYGDDAGNDRRGDKDRRRRR